MVALSISKLRVGAEAYQLSGVAQTLDDYYTGAGEAAGRWVGAGSETLGLGGDVEPDDLRAVLAGLMPTGGGLTPNGTPPIAHPRRVPGFDLTFKVPKSVSVLYAVSDDPRVQGAIIDAGNTAVDHVVGWLEREAVRVRRGSNSVPLVDKREALGGVRDGIREIETTGLVAASFRHRTSRAGDPFLHWHVLAANMAEGVDGKWSSIVHPHLFSHARAAGEVFQAVVRDELTKSLGVEWRPGRHVHEVVGVPDEIMRVFSKRRAEIDAYIAATGTPADGDGHERAALATRRSKGEQETTVGLSQRWRDEAIDNGWGPVEANDLIGAARDGVAVDDAWRLPTVWFDESGVAQNGDRLVDAEEWLADVLRRDLTNESSTFTAVDAVQAVAHRLGDGASVATIERVTNRLLSSPAVLPVGDAFTSRELADVEARFTGSLTASARLDGPSVSAVELGLAAAPTLGGDQAAAVADTATTTAAVSVLIGPAGTGKTYALNTVRELFEASGWRVRGAAPSARAATELASGAGIESSTMHSLLRRLAEGTDRFASTDLLVVDEAGMADIRTLQRLVSAATDAGARVLLVGDHRQLPEVGAGGGFLFATEHAHTVTQLSVNRRQKQPWEQTALTALRDGDVLEAVNAYVSYNRVIVAPDGGEMIEAAVNAWFDAQVSGVDLALVAGTNEMVDRLNTSVLARLTAPGGSLHHTDTMEFGGDTWHVGQRVVVRRNYRDHLDPTVQVRNGQTGTVANSDGREGIMVLLDDTAEPAWLNQRFLDASGRITAGYASTIHRTQGGTWDAAITVGLDGLYREGAYTALSRGRNENLIILTNPEARQLAAEAAQDPPRHDRGLRLPTEEPGTPEAELTDRIRRRQGKHLARHLDPDTPHIDRLAATLPYPALRAAAARAEQIERTATHTTGATPDELHRQLEQATRTATHLAPGVRIKALDRHNIGTVLHLNPTDHTARILFAGDGGREAVRTLSWDDLVVVDPDAAAQPLSGAAQAWLDRHHQRISDQLQAWEGTVSALGSTPDAARLYRRAANVVVDRAVNELAARQPEWLTNLIGPRPVFPEGATAWTAVLTDITRLRLDTHIPASAPGVGLPTTETSDRWLDLQRHIANTKQWLHDHPHHAMTEWPIRPSQQALLQRRAVVDHILDGAPPDQRHIITKLRAGQLTLADTHDALSSSLDTALNGQTARHTWIITNWVHVVEHTEITKALDTANFGPNIETLSQAILGITSSPELAAATRDQHPWLAAALNQLAQPTDTTINHHTVEWLEQAARYRTEHGLDHRDPLGPTPIDPQQRQTRQHLLDRFDTITAGQVERPATEVEPAITQEPEEIDFARSDSSIVTDLISNELAAIDADPIETHSIKRNEPGGIELS